MFGSRRLVVVRQSVGAIEWTAVRNFISKVKYQIKDLLSALSLPMGVVYGHKGATKASAQPKECPENADLLFDFLLS